MINKIRELLSGRKTYLVAIAAGVIFVLARLGHITIEIENTLYAALGITGLVTLRAGVNK